MTHFLHASQFLGYIPSSIWFYHIGTHSFLSLEVACHCDHVLIYPRATTEWWPYGSRYPPPYQGGHIFEKQNSLSFPWDFQGIFKLFSEQLKRGKFDGMHFCWRSCHIVSFSLSFSGFFYKNSNFPEFSLRFWQFFKFPEFSRFSRFVPTLPIIFTIWTHK